MLGQHRRRPGTQRRPGRDLFLREAVHRGHDPLRQLAERLPEELPGATLEYTTVLADGGAAATAAPQGATIEAIGAELGEDGSVRRWSSDPGSFLLTAFWLVECLALAGEAERAEAWFDRAVANANDLGVMSEEVDPATGVFTGNFLQAFSHVGLVNAASRLTSGRAGEPDEDTRPDP